MKSNITKDPDDKFKDDFFYHSQENKWEERQTLRNKINIMKFMAAN